MLSSRYFTIVVDSWSVGWLAALVQVKVLGVSALGHLLLAGWQHNYSRVNFVAVLYDTTCVLTCFYVEGGGRV